MTLEFKEKELAKEMRYGIGNSYIGYISPKGKFVNFNTLFGEPGHDNWRNDASYSFINYVSYIIKDSSLKEYQFLKDYKSFFDENQYPGRDEIVIRGLDYNFYHNTSDFNQFIGYLDKEIDIYKNKAGDPYYGLAYAILKLFKLAYKNGTFFETLGKEIFVMSYEKYITINKMDKYDWRSQDGLYRNYLKKELISYFKDICVQYLRYDSIERFKPDGENIILPKNRNKEYVLEIPRIITTSSPIPNERFYNYLLMDWVIHRLPRYIYNEQTGIFEKESDFYSFYQTEKEQKLDQEIQSIKKLVPIRERYKYFR